MKRVVFFFLTHRMREQGLKLDVSSLVLHSEQVLFLTELNKFHGGPRL